VIGEARNKETSSSSTSDIPEVKATDFEGLLENLSVRAKRVLADLAITDVSSLLRLTQKELIQVWNCGKKTLAELVALQSKLRLQYKWENTPALKNNLDYDKAPIEVFEAVQNVLKARSVGVLRKIGIDSLNSFMMLNIEQLLMCKNCGPKTANEILRIQADIAKFAREISQKPKDFQPEQLLAAPCLRGTDISFSKLRLRIEQEAIQELKDELRYNDESMEVFEAIKSTLSIRGAHVLEALGVNSTTSFMTLNIEELLKCRNCGRKTAKEILRIQADIAVFARDLIRESNDFQVEQLLAAPCLAGITTDQENAKSEEGIFADVEDPAPWLFKWIRGLARSEKQATAFMLRYGMLGRAPMTLEAIGNILKITRERVRQLVKKIEESATYHQQERLSPLITSATEIVQQRGGIVTLAELTKALFCKGKDGDQLLNATKLVQFFSIFPAWRNAGLRLQDDIVSNSTSQILVLRLTGVIEEVASTLADEKHNGNLWSIDRRRLKDALIERVSIVSELSSLADISDALLDTVINQCRDRVRAYKGRVYSADLWHLRFGNIIKMLDIILYRVGKPVHFKEVTELASKWRPNISENNVHSNLDRSNNVLLWDRGTFVHKDNVMIPFSLIHDVECWLLAKPSEDVPFISANGAFLHFRTRCERAALPSEIALYTCLRQSEHPDLVYPRLPWVYLKMGFTQRIPILIAIENYIREAGGPISQHEVKEFLMGKMFLKDFQFALYITQVSNIIRTADRGFLHIDNTEIKQESILPLINYTQELLAKEEHCSVDKIYHEKLVTCRSLGIDGPVMLYSVLQYFAEHLFLLNRYPRVARYKRSRKGDPSTIQQHVVGFIRDLGKPCSYSVLEEHFVEKLRYREQYVYSVISDANVCLYHPGCVIHYKSLAWDEAKQKLLERAALHVYNEAHRAGTFFGRISYLEEYDALPRLPSGLNWSRTMIADLLKRGGRFLVLGNSREAFLPRENDQNICSFEALVGKLLVRDWGGAANLKEFESALVDAGIIKNRLTQNMLGSGQIVVIKSREITLKELLVDAQRP